VVCWKSSGQFRSDDIFAQRFDSNGSKIGEEFLVNTSTFNNQYQPSVGSLINGSFVIVWSGQFDDASSNGIFGQLYHKNGSKNGQQFQINTYTPSTQRKPCVTGLLDGGFVVAWESDGQDGHETGIFGQIYDAQGEKRGEEFQVNTQTANWQWNPKVCALSKGRFVITWESEDEYEFGPRMGVHARLFDHQGVALSEEFLVNSSQYSSSRFPGICSLSNGGFVICWEGYEEMLWEEYSGIVAQVYDSLGAIVFEKFPVNVNNENPGAQSLPRVCRLAHGGFVICWESFMQDGSGDGIYAQLYDKNAVMIGEEFRVNTYISDFQEKPSLSALSENGFVICWQSMYQDGSLSGIYGKYFLETQIQHSLHTFSLLSPAFDATSMSTSVDFQWEEASSTHVNFPWELKYTLYLDVSDNFDEPDVFTDIYDAAYSVKDLIPGQTYFWKVWAKTYEGDSLWSTETFGFHVSHAAGIRDKTVLKPDTYKLFPNYPNPFNPRTIINYELPITNFVDLSIYNLRGQKVVTLVSGRQKTGYHQIEWDASGFASGVYFLTLEAGNFKATQKMLLVR
jgi:hypothetical protein